MLKAGNIPNLNGAKSTTVGYLKTFTFLSQVIQEDLMYDVERRTHLKFRCFFRVLKIGHILNLDDARRIIQDIE